MAATRVGGFGVEGRFLHGTASPSRGRRRLLHGSGVFFARAAAAASSSRGQRRRRLDRLRCWARGAGRSEELAREEDLVSVLYAI
jgi:hypothetical protein